MSNLYTDSYYSVPSNVLIPFIIISNDKSKLSLIDTGLPKALLFTSKENPSKKLRSVLMI